MVYLTVFVFAFSIILSFCLGRFFQRRSAVVVVSKPFQKSIDDREKEGEDFLKIQQFVREYITQKIIAKNNPIRNKDVNIIAIYLTKQIILNSVAINFRRGFLETHFFRILGPVVGEFKASQVSGEIRTVVKGYAKKSPYYVLLIAH